MHPTGRLRSQRDLDVAAGDFELVRRRRGVAGALEEFGDGFDSSSRVHMPGLKAVRQGVGCCRTATVPA